MGIVSLSAGTPFAKPTHMMTSIELHLARLIANRADPTPAAIRLTASIVARLGSLREVATAPERELCGAGLSARQAARVFSAFRLVAYGLAGALPRGACIDSAQQAFLLLRHLELDKGESFWAIALNIGCQAIVPPILIAKGNTGVCPVRPADFFAPLIRVQASVAVAVHNHPTGSSAPSLSDVRLTQRLIWVGEVAGVPLLDHVIIAGGTYTSLKSERGLRDLWERPMPDAFSPDAFSKEEIDRVRVERDGPIPFSTGTSRPPSAATAVH